MSFNPLSLSHPESNDEVINLTHSPSDYIPSTPVSENYIPSTPEGPPPSSPLVTRRVRAPRRCSVCRQTGHNIRNCPDAAGVHYRGQIYNVYPHPRDNLIQFVISYFVERAPRLSSFPSLIQNLYQDIFFHISMMTWNEVKTALRNPEFFIDYARERVGFWIENYRIVMASREFAPTAVDIRLPATPRLTGKDYAQNIEVEHALSKTEASECYICSDKMCSVTTGCGHDFCTDCVTKIIDGHKHKTSGPLCSFCKAPFVKFSVSDPSVFATLSKFIQDLDLNAL